jgi:hypothetical protein
LPSGSKQYSDRPLPSAPKRGRLFHGQAAGLQVLDQRRFIERLDAQAEVIDVAPLGTGRPAALPAQLALQVDEIDHRSPGAQVHQTQRLVVPDHLGTKDLAVKIDTALQIGDAQDDVINMLNRKRMHKLAHPLCSCRPIADFQDQMQPAAAVQRF